MRKEKMMFRTFDRLVENVTCFNMDTKALEVVVRETYDGIEKPLASNLKPVMTEIVKQDSVKVQMTISDFIKYGEVVEA